MRSWHSRSCETRGVKVSIRSSTPGTFFVKNKTKLLFRERKSYLLHVENADLYENSRSSEQKEDQPAGESEDYPRASTAYHRGKPSPSDTRKPSLIYRANLIPSAALFPAVQTRPIRLHPAYSTRSAKQGEGKNRRRENLIRSSTGSIYPFRQMM